MFKLWKKQGKSEDAAGRQWDEKAKQALDQAVAQAPVPKMLKGQVRQRLAKAAEAEAQKNGRTQVTPEDLMAGLLAHLPVDVRNQIEQAAKQGPEGLKKLQKNFGKNPGFR